MKKRILLAVSLLFSCGFLFAQQTGNIVEYFGRERVETIDEGSVLHWFSQGYAVSSSGGFGGDALTMKLLNNELKRPGANDLQISGIDTISWQELAVDSTGRFSGPRSRRPYVLYTEFNSNNSQIVLLEASGNGYSFVNGLPREGDSYDFAYTLIPFRMKKGNNEFAFTTGRGGRIVVKLITPRKPVLFTKRDMTIPDVINGENNEKWGGIRIVNAQEKDLNGLTIKCTLESGETATCITDNVMPLTVRKVRFLIPAARASKTGPVNATLVLLQGGKEIDRTEIILQQRDASVIHERSFISNIDGSVQYYSVTPSTTKADNQALFLSLHGAGVEARNQARAYTQKDWGHVISATNRRPYGFNWEYFGRIDALEVLADAKAIFKTAPEKTYLTGHSMGGHGTWHVGVTYPDKFAAIAPCASYPDIARYGGRGFFSDNVNQNREITHTDIISRAANAGRTLDLIDNLLQQGVYIFHGSEDRTVPTMQARYMRQVLGEFHPDFCYYEYPGGSHWFSNESVDWLPIFEFFRRHKLYTNDEVKSLDFSTATPAISEKDYWVTVIQQDTCYGFSNVKFNIRDNRIIGTTRNTSALSLDIPSLKLDIAQVSIIIDNETIQASTSRPVILKKIDKKWQVVDNIPATEKNPKRYGGFKQAFDNKAVFVYATGGTKEENEWYLNKARFDAESFLYRGNGSFTVIADKDFTLEAYSDRNVIIYGNATNNKAWAALMSGSPVQVKNGEISIGSKVYKGNDYGTCFIYPRHDSETASVGVVAGTGIAGMKAAYSNSYLSGTTGNPDLSIFNSDILRRGVNVGVKVSGFFGNDWSVEKGDFLMN